MHKIVVCKRKDASRRCSKLLSGWTTCKLLSVFLYAGTVSLVASAESEGYEPATAKFGMSRWAEDVSAKDPLPKYPRPQMARKKWKSLNGLWDYTLTDRDAESPDMYQGRILVPFCIEAPLSGVGRMISSFPGRTYSNTRLWYRRNFKVPSEWFGRRILLHFGAVDWEAVVFLNGTKLGVHKGGYDEFTFDVTEELEDGGPNEIVLAVWDPTSEGRYPCGKQNCNPGGILYTPCSGIWQTVWLEPVPQKASVRDLAVVPDIDNDSASVRVEVLPADSDVEVRLTALDGEDVVSQGVGRPGEDISLQIENPKYTEIIAEHRARLPKKHSKILGSHSTGHRAYAASEAREATGD